MTKEEMLDYKLRHDAKIKEIRSTYIALEKKYIEENKVHDIGSDIQIDEKVVKNKKVPVMAKVGNIEVDWTMEDSPKLRYVLYNEEGKYVKSLYL